MAYIDELGIKALKAKEQLIQIDTEKKNAALRLMAKNLLKHKEAIKKANTDDVINAKEKGTKEALTDRLILNDARIESMAKGLMEISQFPEPIGNVLYERVLPKTPSIFVKISREELEGALERASLIVDDKATGTWRGYIKCSFEGDRLIITSNSVSGSVYDEVPIEKDGDDIQIVFTCHFLLDAVKAADTEYLLMSLTSNRMGVSITDGDASEAGDSDFLFYVMPQQRVKE